MRDQWFTVKKIAEASGFSPRHVRRLAASGAWEFRETVLTTGVTERRYHLSSLPQKFQQDIASRTLSIDIAGSTGRLSQRAEAKLTVLALWENFKNNTVTGDAATEFCKAYPSIASDELLAVIPKISRMTLFRWLAKSKESADQLVPRHGLHRKGLTKLPKRFHKLVLAAYMDQNQRSARAVYSHIIHKLALESLPETASPGMLAARKKELQSELSPFVVLNFIKQNTAKGLRSLARGMKNEREKVKPYVKRTRRLLASNDIWVSDGHDANNYVIAPNGRIIRPVIVAWMDERSRMITGFDVDITENTDLIVSSLVSAVEQHGIPEKIYVDNGRAYMNKRTSEKFQSENRMKVYHMLDAEVITARPYNAREKSIERFWGTLDGSFAKFLPGYTGKNTVSKPESTELAVKRGHLLTLEQYKAALAKYILKYNTDIHTGEGMDNRSPYEVYKDHLEDIREASQDVLLKLRLVHLAEERTVLASGVVRARNREYIAPELLAHVGEKVSVALDPNNLGIAYIYLNGELLTKAQGLVTADFENTENTQRAFRERRRLQNSEKKLKKQLRELKAETSAVYLEEITRSEGVDTPPTIEDKTIDITDY